MGVHWKKIKFVQIILKSIINGGTQESEKY